MKRSFFVVLGSLSLASSLVAVACSDDDANVGSQGNNSTLGGSAGKGGSATGGTGGASAGKGGTSNAGTGGSGTAGTGGSSTAGSGGSGTAGSGGSGSAGAGGNGSAGAGGAGPGKPCGGLAGLACGADEVCVYPESATCGIADALGACEAKPTDCGDGCQGPSGAPCACDGLRYCSTCEILKKGLSPAPDSFCKGGNGGAGGGTGGAAGAGGGKTCGGFNTTPCADDELCDYPLGAACGVADGTGTCKPKPSECAIGCPAPEFQPCACDGQKYCNACEINKKGLSLAPASFCQGNGGAAGAGGGGGAAGAGGAPPCTPFEMGAGGAVHIFPTSPTAGTACPVEGFELCTGSGVNPITLSKCVGGKWQTLESPSTCTAGYQECNGFHDPPNNACCETARICGGALCDGKRWHK